MSAFDPERPGAGLSRRRFESLRCPVLSLGADMQRREFITLLGGAAAVWPLAARAQQPDRVRRIGVLQILGAGDPEWQIRFAAFKQGLQELGWLNERNVTFEFRNADGRIDRLPALAAELVHAN